MLEAFQGDVCHSKYACVFSLIRSQTATVALVRGVGRGGERGLDRYDYIWPTFQCFRQTNTSRRRGPREAPINVASQDSRWRYHANADVRSALRQHGSDLFGRRGWLHSYDSAEQ